MLYDAEYGRIIFALCGDLMPSRRLAVHRERGFLALRDLLRGADACFANLESMVIRYGEGTPAIRTGTHMVIEPETWGFAVPARNEATQPLPKRSWRK